MWVEDALEYALTIINGVLVEKKERITDDLSTSKGKWKEKLSRDQMRELDHGRSNSNLPEIGCRASRTICNEQKRRE